LTIRKFFNFKKFLCSTNLFFQKIWKHSYAFKLKNFEKFSFSRISDNLTSIFSRIFHFLKFFVWWKNRLKFWHLKGVMAGLVFQKTVRVAKNSWVKKGYVFCFLECNKSILFLIFSKQFFPSFFPLFDSPFLTFCREDFVSRRILIFSGDCFFCYSAPPIFNFFFALWLFLFGGFFFFFWISDFYSVISILVELFIFFIFKEVPVFSFINWLWSFFQKTWKLLIK
jgi:hypothetical protein